MRIGPGLDPDSILCARERAVPDIHALHRLFVRVLSEAADADPMSRPAIDAGDGDLLASIAEGDAVVAGFDVGVGDVDSDGSSNVDPVCVEALSWGRDREVVEGQVVAPQHVHVELLAV